MVSTTLSANVGPCSGNGLVVGANGIVLDCAGHSISGVSPSAGHVGVYLKGVTGVTIKNCKVTGFSDGFYLDNAPGNTFSGNTVNHVLIGFYAEYSSEINTLSGKAEKPATTDYTVSVSTNSSSYYGSQTILVTGSVSPPPGSGTSAIIDVFNPSGTLVRTDDVTVDGTTGAFSDSFVAGGTNWINGAYTIEATWAPTITGTPVVGRATFVYAITSTTTTVTTTTTTATKTSYTVSVSTNSSSYYGSQTILVTGSVSPPPGSGTSATIDVWNPSGTLVRTDDVTVDGTTGAFSDSFVAGGTNWIDGAYTVEVTWAPSITGTTVIGTTAFTYATTTSTTTTTTTTSTTTITTYTISVSMNSFSYSGSQTILVTGLVSPAPGSGTSALIDVFNPSTTLVHTDDVPVNGTTGAFSDSFVAGGTNWIDGAYTVEVTWAPSITGTPVIATAAFGYVTASIITTTITTTTTVTATQPGPILNVTNYQSVQNQPNAVFRGDATGFTNGSVSYNFLGTGGNDTFDLYGGNTSAVFLATGVMNNTFNIVTGDPGSAGILGVNSTTFSLISGANSTFNILQNNYNSSVTFSIIAGPNSVVNDTSTGPVFNTLFSINLGTNSTVSLGSQFVGNETTINVVY